MPTVLAFGRVMEKSHQALFSRGIVFSNPLIAAPLQRKSKSRFEKMKVAALTNLIGEIDMKRFPVGGPRQPVYSFISQSGFVMSPWSDKHWNRADGVQLHLFGAGSMARISDYQGNLLIEAPLAEAVSKLKPKT